MSPLGDIERVRRLEEASDWVQRVHSASQDEGLLEEWLEWCQKHPLNQQAFDEILAVWELGGKLQPATAAAAPQPSNVVAASFGEPQQSAARAAVPVHTRRFALAASLGALGLAAVLATWLGTRPGEEAHSADYASPVGANSKQMLADGSHLDLGGGTRVTFTMDTRSRVVQLHEGELFVAVHHEAARPFLVTVGKLAVTATGTAFNVLRTAGRTTVTVVEGSVNAAYGERGSASPGVQLSAGQQLVYNHNTHRVSVRELDPRDAIAWRSGMLNFRNEPLAEVIATVNRYAPRQIVIEDPGIRELSFTGTARIDRIDDWVRALPHAFPVTVAELDEGRQLIGPRPGGAPD